MGGPMLVLATAYARKIKIKQTSSKNTNIRIDKTKSTHRILTTKRNPIN